MSVKRQHFNQLMSPLLFIGVWTAMLVGQASDDLFMSEKEEVWEKDTSWML